MAARILIIEDEAVVSEMLARQLAGWGYETRAAASAEDALALLGRETCDAVLLDNNLPGMTGMKALAELRRRTAAPVLMMTGHYDEEFRKDAALLGAADMLSKPIAAKDLEAALAKALAAGR